MTELPLLLFGAGGHAKVVLDALECLGELPERVIDDAPRSETLLGVQVMQNSAEVWKVYPQFRFHVALGGNAVRRRYFEQLREKGGVAFTVVHPRTVISRHARLGEGCFVAGGVIINPGAEIGENCIINTGASIDHDCQIGAHSHICPGVRLAGNVTVGTESMVGTGTSIIPGMVLGDRVTVGAGAAVVRDIPSGSTACGVPARILKASQENG